MEIKYTTRQEEGTNLLRIIAARDFNGVLKGTLGGLVGSEANLTHLGTAWVYGNAKVYDNAKVYGDAQVSGNAWVFGNAQVFGDAWVFGDAQVFGKALVHGDALVFGTARVCGNALVSGTARVCGNALVYGTAWVYGDAKVCGNARVSGDAAITPKVLTGFPFTVTFTDDHIRAGCQFHTIEAWCARGAAMIKAEGHPTVTAKAWHSIIMAVSAEHQKDVEQGKLYAK